MTYGGKGLKELLRKHGRTVNWVAAGIDIDPQTITRWTDNAPIGRLYEISKYAGIDIHEIIECFNPDRIELTPDDRIGGENN